MSLLFAMHGCGRLGLVAAALFFWSFASAFVVRSPKGKHQKRSLNAASMSMYVSGEGAKSPANLDIANDRTKIGSLSVPTVGVGTISWSTDCRNSIDNLELQELVSTACTVDGAFFDTAERYGSHAKTMFGLGWGETEMLTRKLIENSASASTPIVATKFTPTPWRTTAKSVVEACEQSLQRLGVDSIDLYQLHMPDIVRPLRFLGSKAKDEIYWDGLAECYHRGLIKNVGVCNYGPTLLMRCQEALAKRDVPLASNQIAYSLIGRHNGSQETLEKCNELGIKVLAFFPLAMGLLTGKYSQHSVSVKDPTESLTTSRKTQLEMNDLKRYALGDKSEIPNGGIGPLANVMQSIAQTRGKTVAQVALNYIICKGAIPIPGARTKAQVIDNMGAMGWRLSDTEIEMLEQTADRLGFGFEGAGFKRTSEKFVGYGVEKWSLD